MSGNVVSDVTETEGTAEAVSTRGQVISWATWDWGSAAFNAVATTFVFSVYLTGSKLFADPSTANSYLSIGMTVAGVIVALVAPITGQRADRGGSGSRSVGIFTFLVVACLAAMFFVAPESALGPTGALILGVTLLSLGNIFFEFASVNYNAMLNYVSTPKNRGLISGFGWGLGYFGGIVLLLILFVGFISPEVGWFGVTSRNGLDIRVSMLVAALWFATFALPVLLNPPASYRHQSRRQVGSVFDSYRHLFRTVKNLAKKSPDTLRFLISSAIFRDGLAGVFTFGGVIAASVFGFSAGEVIIFAIAANVVAGFSTILVGKFDDQWGPKRVIVLALIFMVVAGMGIFFFHDRGETIFWVLGLTLTIFVGPAQSASRSLLARKIPAGHEGEMFGLYATTGRAVSFLAPMFYGLAILVGKQVLPEGIDPTYWGILGIVLVILIGLVLLLPVKASTAPDPTIGT